MPRPEHITIAAPDGIRLAATLYFPDGDGPWPALLEALPYRKDDISDHSTWYEGFASAGYVACRLDLRGTGSSEGLALDEYTATERADLAAVVDWLSSQPWSTGAVGMFGTSYSGFNSLQLATDRPPALKAIVSIFASDDRFGDDVHYMGGVLKALDIVDYPTYMVALNALPPVPAIYGDGWREEWKSRIEGAEPWILKWLEHQTHDDYWRYGSAREEIGRIQAATMIVGGWADGYTNVALRSFPRLRAPKRLLLGPWSHADVETCRPGPNIDLDAEMIRWWDRWLKGVENGIDDEPPIVVYQQRSTLPDPVRPLVNGEWRFEPTWPPERLRPSELRLADAERGGLASSGGSDGSEAIDVLEVRGDVGVTAWISCAGAMPWGQSSDQRPDELHSLTYTWPALPEELEIMGHPVLRVRVTSDEPVAYLAAKVCDVFPDGTSSLVVRGVLNLTHRSSRSDPEPLVSGEPVDIELDLEDVAWTFEAGHRIRLDLAGSDWPNTWGPPAAATLAIHRGTGTLELPVLEGPPPAAPTPELRPSDLGQGDPTSKRDGGWVRWEVVDDVLGGERRVVVGSGGDHDAEGDGPSIRDEYGGTVAISPHDPGGSRADGVADLEICWPEATCRARSEVRLVSDDATYRIEIDLTAWEDGQEIARRTWEREIPRNLQ
jgi:hypothetical protein